MGHILHVRSWARRLAAGAFLLAAFYLLAANLFLLPSIGSSLISRQPERFRLSWQSAWSLWPGEVRFQGLEIRGNQPRVRWWITAERGTARIDLPALWRREVHIESLHAVGVRSQTDRLVPPSEPPSPRPAPRRAPWTVRLEGIELSGVRELGYGPLRLQGEGRIAGSFRIVMRREVEVGPAVLSMPRGRLLVREAEVARDVALRAELRLGPYSPRQHRGAAGFDFLTGHLTAEGRVAELPVLAKIAPAEAEAVRPGGLAVDLRVERGRLVPGSRFDFAAPGVGLRGCVHPRLKPGARNGCPFGTEGLDAQAGCPLCPNGTAISSPGFQPGVRLSADAQSLALRRRDGTPFLEAGEARLAAATPELRLSRLITDVRSMRHLRTGLSGGFEAADLRLRTAGRNAAVEITADQARGEIDLPALLARRVALAGLEAEGVAVRVKRGAQGPSILPVEQQRPWAVEIREARIEQIREIGSEPWRLAGTGRAAGSFTWNGKELTIQDSRLEVRDGRLWQGTEELARGLDARLDGHLAPCALRGRPALAVLDCARLALRATAAVHRLRTLPALGAAGTLRTEVRLQRGLLAPGSFLEIGPALIARVEGGDTPRLAAEVRDFALGGGPDRPPVLRAAAARASVPAEDLHVGRLLAARQARLPLADLEASGLRMGAAGERVGWEVTLDQASGKLDLAALARREIAFSKVRGAGARLEVRRTGGEERAVSSPAAHPWTVRIADARILGLREASFGTNRLWGNGRIEGSLEASFGGGARSCRLDRLALAFDSARIQSDRTTVARRISVLSELRIAPFTPGELRGSRLFRLISGSLSVEGEVSSLGFLRTWLRKAPWLTLDGRGHLAADLRLDAGRLQPGTRVVVDPAEAEAEYLLSRATGVARVEGLVVAGPGEPHLVLGVNFGRFRIAAREPWDAPAHVLGEGLQLSLTSSDLDLAEPGRNLQARIVLPEADVRDLAFYNAYLPPGTGVSILEGAGRLGFDLRVQAEGEGPGQTAEGEVTLRSDAMRVRIEDLELAGALDLSARLSSPDLRRRRFGLEGTRLSLDRVVLRHVGPNAGPPQGRRSETGWWARLELGKGGMEWSRPLVLDSAVRLEMKEAGFLFSMLSRQKPYLAWFGNRLRKTTPVVARGELRLAQGAIEVSPLEVVGGHFDIRSRLRFSRERRHGDLFVRWRRLALGVELEGRERSYRFLRPLAWFESRAWKGVPTAPAPVPGPERPAATGAPSGAPDRPARRRGSGGGRSTARGRPAHPGVAG